MLQCWRMQLQRLPLRAVCSVSWDCSRLRFRKLKALKREQPGLLPRSRLRLRLATAGNSAQAQQAGSQQPHGSRNRNWCVLESVASQIQSPLAYELRVFTAGKSGFKRPEVHGFSRSSGNVDREGIQDVGAIHFRSAGIQAIGEIAVESGVVSNSAAHFSIEGTAHDAFNFVLDLLEVGRNAAINSGVGFRIVHSNHEAVLVTFRVGSQSGTGAVGKYRPLDVSSIGLGESAVEQRVQLG